MKRALRIVHALLTTYYAYMVEYRAELLLWALSGSLPFILMGIWMQASAGGRFGLAPLDFARYFLAAFVMRQFNVVWVMWDLEQDIVQGKLSTRLLQPLDPGWHYFISHIAERFARFPFVVVLVVLFFLLYPKAWWLPRWDQGLLTVGVIVLSFSLRFLIQYTFAMLAFWTERANAIEQFWFLVYLFLSGIIAPLEVFPASVRAIVQWTPFPYMIHFPAAILVGLPVNIPQGLLAMVGWIGVVFLCNRWVWRQGLRQYSGMGA